MAVPNTALANAEFTDKFVGVEVAKTITFALLALTVYEYLITLDEEERYFWTGPFSVSHALFFCNRYFPPIALIVLLICFTISDPKPLSCLGAVQMFFLLDIIGIGAIKAILLVRVWFLFPGNKAIRSFLVLGFLTSLVMTLYLLYDSVSKVAILLPTANDRSPIIGCRAERPPAFWKVYLPTLILHTCLYVMTVYQALSDPETRKRKQISKCLLRDGGMFYFIVMCSVSFTSIGSILVNSPKINFAAIFSPIVLSTTSLATTRIIFSLRAVTSRVGNDFEWLSMPLPHGQHELDTSPNKNHNTKVVDEEKGYSQSFFIID
ncbi:hypothetical protein BJ165DRAFT_446745 [Panaeolus papilionaceus]|nr:hypothetical protein BJ165DRAFT_446745 [Panaeolus papilionaceus]